MPNRLFTARLPRARGNPRARACHAIAVALTLSLGLASRSPALASPWSGRTNFGVGSMLSRDQVEKLRYDSVGFVGGAAVSRKLVPWLSAQLWLRGGSFLSDVKKGGLLGSTLGLRLHSGEREVMPYLSFDAGACVTGTFVRPWFGATVGVDWRVRDWMTLGPVAGFDQIVQWNKPMYSTDAIYFWVGLGVAYDNATQAPVPRKKPAPQAAVHEPPLEPATPVENDSELEALIERTITPSTTRLELLAPVLFALDSDQIEPIGIAMLHEVAHTLRTRPEIRLLEIQGYADMRGSQEHNQGLSQRRAERVRGWLIEHGIAPERLVVAAHGASLPVESAASEAAYEQNRRVVFRVLELAEP